MKKYPTLAAIKMGWVAYLDIAGTITLICTILIALFSQFIDYPFLKTAIVFGLVIWVGSFLIEHIVFYSFIKCPQCRSKLNKFKNGKNIPEKLAYNNLEKGLGCKNCGWKPENVQKV